MSRREVSFDANPWPAVALGLILLMLALTGGCEVETPSKLNTATANAEQNESSVSPPETKTPTAEHKHTNALVHETSPYLLQHAHNPVNWHPWGEAAFKLAKEQNKPIFLSVGYSTCYWCHVMERESFENEEVAAVLNEHFICIKVDREERPDVDEQYMLATQLFTGRGGWPNSVWLTPDGRPWMAGTYFPRESFVAGLTKLAEAWRDQPELVEKQANSFKEAIQNSVANQQRPGLAKLSRDLVKQSIELMQESFDEQHGGFGGKPKFPPHGDLRLLLREAERTGDAKLLSMATKTLDAIWLGGIHDHLGGGFHRYATDNRWFLPHFEKMLYDNAQLMRAYTDAHVVTSEPRYREAVADIFAWLQREMTHPDGGFYSALDAGDAGEEGVFYVWTSAEIAKVLGVDDARLFGEHYGIAAEGNFSEEATGERPGTNIPFLSKPLPSEDAEKLATLREKLLAMRNKREFPRRDDKVLASWNGLMIAALAHAGKELEEPKYTQAATKAAEFLVKNLLKEGTLQRSWREGEAKLPGYLDDYAYVLDALIELHEATGDKRWLDQSQQLADKMLAEFEDESGGFYFTGGQHEELLVRSKSLTGNGNLPSGNGVAAQALLRLGKLTTVEKYTTAARRTLESLADLMARQPGATETLVLATAMLLDEPPAAAQTAKDDSVIAVEVFSSRKTAQPGQTFPIAVKLTIEKGWHLYGPNPDVKFVVPTTLSLVETPVATLEDLKQPPGKTKEDPVLKESVAVYEGEAWLRGTITIDKDAELGQATLQLKLRAQACDESRCLEPRTATLPLSVEIVEKADEELRHPEVFKEE